MKCWLWFIDFRLVGRSVGPSVGWSVCSFLSALFLINYWTNFIQTSQVNSVSSRDVHMKCWLWFIDFRLVCRSVGPSVGWSVCSFLSALFLINYWTNFIQTSQVNSVSSRDVHMKCWLWFIDFSLSYGPFMRFLVRSFSHQLLDRFGSNYTNRLSIKQRCAYPILVMVYVGFMEL